MPNIIDALGITVKTRAELIAEYTTAYQTIYGTDINLAQDTPDGQMMNIQVQAILDLQDFVVQCYNSFNPDNALGRVLDQRVALNGIQRQAGTYTITPITIVSSQACNLYGLNQSVQDVYTVQDNAGNKWLLQNTQFISGATTTVADFRAENPGAVLTIPNTITVPFTIVLGVTSVNNPTAYSTLGINEESDAVLKVRRQLSVSLPSQGYLEGLLAALLNINGIASAQVYENNTDVTDGDGIPAHSIWVITSGTALDADIAQAIYTKRNAGCGMRGDVTYTITQVDLSPFIVRWDEVITEKLFIFFTATSIDGENIPDLLNIRPDIVTDFIPGVSQEVNINALATVVQNVDANTLVTNAGFTTARIQILDLSLVPASGLFKLNYNGNTSADINWNDNLATITSKIQAVSGLGSAVVSGSLAGQQIEIDLTNINTVESLITVSGNTLEDSFSDPVVITLDVSPSTTLEPTTKQFQFVVEEANVIIIALQLLPSASSVATGDTKQFTTYGGYGDYTYSILINNSGGTIDVNGLYEAGVTPGVDTLQVVDALGNSITAIVSVT